jgi:hypothetical protein
MYTLGERELPLIHPTYELHSPPPQFVGLWLIHLNWLGLEEIGIFIANFGVTSTLQYNLQNAYDFVGLYVE